MDTARSTLLIAALARQLAGCRVIAVGANSPLPAAAALLAKAKSPDRVRVLILGSRTQNEFTDGGRELFDCAAQGRIDAFFLSGGQIDGEANLNLIGVGDYPELSHRFPGSFGSAYLYYLIPRVILFREEHTPRVLVPKVDFVSAPGVTPSEVYRRGGPHSLVTGRCVFAFDRSRRRFRLDSLHPGETPEHVRANTGFDFDMPSNVTKTAGLTAQDINLLGGRIADEIAETYPRFAATLAKEAA
jgi:glutaconate CoA-transferase, subunit B